MMADETKYRRCERLFRNCGIWLVVLVAAALVYLAPLAVLARLEEQSGDKRFLIASLSVNADIHHAESLFAGLKPVGQHENLVYSLNVSILNTLYNPVLSAASGRDEAESQFARFVLGIE